SPTRHSICSSACSRARRRRSSFSSATTVLMQSMKSLTTYGAFGRAWCKPDLGEPMPHRLLDRQANLLSYLTSGAAILGDGSDIPPDPALRGIDPALLRLEARFSYEKRLEKIAAIFPRTLAMLGDQWGPLFQGFVAACPPTDISRQTNAREFHEYLV